jgi:hypothetical protein
MSDGKGPAAVSRGELTTKDAKTGSRRENLGWNHAPEADRLARGVADRRRRGFRVPRLAVPVGERVLVPPEGDAGGKPLML